VGKGEKARGIEEGEEGRQLFLFLSAATTHTWRAPTMCWF
jgi:hypothetical protein